MGYSEELEKLVRAHWESMGNHLLDLDSDKAMWEMLDERRADEALDLLACRIPFPLAGCRLLEIGSGVGATQVAARQRGIKSVGLEPGPGVYAARQLLSKRGFSPTDVVCGVAEGLPFRDSMFDVVCSFQVLEHTRNPELALDEAIRVLKPCGYFVHVFPNYGSFWEGHYGIPWLPHLPRTLGRLYVRLLGYDPSMLESLQLLSHGRVASFFDRHPRTRIEGWGLELWEQRVRTLEFSEWAHLGRLKRIAHWLHRLRLVNLAVAVGRACHFETPIVLVGTKLPPAV